MADMNDVKERLKSMLYNNEEVSLTKKLEQRQVVCVFHLDSFDDVEAVGEALKKNFLVLLDISGCEADCALRIRDFMKGVAYPMQVWIQEMSENILVYLPDGYQIQEFQNER